VVIGLPSSGAHSNGYSLVRKIIARAQPDLTQAFDGENDARRSDPGADADLRQAAAGADAGAAGQGPGAHHRWRPHRQRAAHPAAAGQGRDRAAAWPRPKLFDWLQREGGVADSEMHRVFNCGIGMVVVVAREDVQQAVQILHAAGEAAVVIGAIKPRGEGEAATISWRAGQGIEAADADRQ
jgi:phosphoribosylformylglycinamidine cyclo-ligase